MPLKKAWRSVIQATRERRRRTGQVGMLGSLGDVERIRTRPLRAGTKNEVLIAIKRALGRVHLAPAGSTERDHALESLEALLSQTICAIQEAPLALRVSGWPSMLDRACLERLLGLSLSELGSLEVGQVVELVHRLDGQNIGGSQLKLDPSLEPGHVLPPLPRADRDRSQRGGSGPWLEVVDEESRFSLTPAPIAKAQAALFRSRTVIDVFGGVGGNAVALAQRGLQVIVLEPDSERLEAARRSLKQRGLLSNVQLIADRLEARLPDLLRASPDAGLFLDPPWGGKNWRPEDMRWSQLLAPFEGIQDCVESATEVVLKLPRSFDLNSLPERASGWSARLEWAGPSTLPRLLTVWG